ncbi:MAG: hypothetical protein HYZ14_04735 [Bacteroidetes bacterium]|nr:hypothetical protein [Bacteroidota bacterium]
MEKLVNIHAWLLHKSDNLPVSGERYKVRFYDKDFIQDDFLGESVPDQNGHVIVTVVRDDFSASESFSEKYPDVYFEIFADQQLIFKSTIFRNLHLEETEDMPASEGLHFNLGTFII